MAQLNTEFPTWMIQQDRDNAAIGSMLGQNILQGLRFQEEKARYNDLTPMRQAQIATAQAQAQIAQNNANLNALAVEDEARARGSMADALALQQDIASSPTGFTNPESRARFYSFLSANPWLGDKTWAQNMEQSFTSADTYRRRADEIMMRSQADLDLEKERQRGDLAVEQERNRSGSTQLQKNIRGRVEAEIAAGRLAPEKANERIDELYAESTLTAAQKNSKGVVDSMIDAGLVAPEDANKVMAQARQNGGRIPEIPAATVIKLGERAATIELTDAVVNEIDAFKSKYGEGALDSYLGQFDVPFDRALDIIRKRNTPKDQDALRILQSFEDVRSGKIKTTSGATVTVAEQARLDKAIGTTLNKNFEQMLRTFNRNERLSYKTVLDGLEDRRVPESYKRIAEGPVQAAVKSSGVPTVTSKAEYDALPSGAKFIDSTGKVKTKR